MRSAIESFFNRLWYSGANPWLAYVLRPAAWVYSRLAQQRWQAHAHDRTQSFAVPVVVVGNIVAGGSGKTPVSQALALSLTAKGLRVGIVSRGYGGTTKTAAFVDATQPAVFGDEPCLLASTTACPVAVASARADAVRLLLKHHVLDIILSDDGMQHAALHRDFELCVVGAKGFGNGLCLPAGPLREPLSRLQTVSAVLSWGSPCPQAPASLPQWVIFGAHSLLQLLSGNAAPEGTLQALATLQNKTRVPIVAAAGLAHPERFYTSLAGAGLRFSTLPVPDHGMLSTAQLKTVNEQALLLITEKDAVKWRAAALPAHLQKRVRIVPWRVTLPSALIDTIAALVTHRAAPHDELKTP